MIYTLRDNFTPLLLAAVTLASSDWFWNALPQSVMYLIAQNYLEYQINMHEMEGEHVDTTILTYTAVQSGFICFLFTAISYAMFSSQAHLFLKNQLTARQNEQMQDVLQEIDDGVIILEEKKEEDKKHSFINVEFANSFMQHLFGSSFKSESPESAERISELAKKPIVSKTTKQILSQKDINSAVSSDSTSLEKLILSAEGNSRKTSKDNFLVINAPKKGSEENKN